MAKLVVLTDGFTGRACELKADRTTIGRADDNAFEIPEPSVSSHHCEILLRGNEVVVRDLKSTNGTFINGETVTEGVLKPGQVLRLGQIELRLDNGGTAPPTKKPMEHGVTGVKLNDLEQGSRTVVFDANSAFKKKSNKINQAFIGVLILLGVLIVALLLYAVLTTGGN
jgi:pSer/pThr/pTyr-binding forkhead associated (FHA) protein